MGDFLKVFIICIFIISLQLFILYNVYQPFSLYNTTVINSCKLSKADQYLLKTQYGYPQFTKNMELLRKQRIEIGLNPKYTVNYSNITFIPYAKRIWIEFIPFLFISNPSYFTFVSGFADIYPPKNCYKGTNNQSGNITWIFNRPPLSDPNTIKTSKSHTELIHRNIRNNFTIKYPETYIIKYYLNELDLFLSKYEHYNNFTWILKPDTSFGGNGISISNDIETIKELAYKLLDNNGGVIQKILDNPYLFKNRRFSLRIWTAITSVYPFIAYYSPNIFLVLKTSEYTHNDTILEQVLSNEHFQKSGRNYDPSHEFILHLKEKKLLTRWLEYTLPLIRNGFYEFLLQVSLQESQAKTMEVFGCDVILDNNLVPYLLECNVCAGTVYEFYPLIEEIFYITLYEQMNNNEKPSNLRYWEKLFLN